MSLLGGAASPIGSAIGTGLLILIPEWLRFLKSVPGLYLAIYGLSVILIIRFMPDGIWGFVNAATSSAGARKAKAPPAAAGAATDAGDRRRRHRARSHRAFETFRRPQGGRWRRHRRCRRGGVHALIGPNGSGKTTTLNVLSGLYKATAGKIVLDGTDITDMPPHQRTAAGLGPHVPEHPPVPLDDRAGERRDRRRAARQYADRQGGDAALTERAMAALTFVGLGSARQRTDLELLLRPSAADRDRPRAGRPIRRCCCSTSPPPA